MGFFSIINQVGWSAVYGGEGIQVIPTSLKPFTGQRQKQENWYCMHHNDLMVDSTPKVRDSNIDF